MTSTARLGRRRVRFGIGASLTADPKGFLDKARAAERCGFSVFGVADHFTVPFSPVVAAQAVADATSTIGIGQMMLNQDFRHPAVLAKDLATIDVLSHGRLEIGIGAGWMEAEYEQAGMRFDRASTRIERLEETLVVLRGLFGDTPCYFDGRHFTITGLNGMPKPVQQPAPPIMVGGNGPRLLAAAARQADIIQVTGGIASMTGSMSEHMTAHAFRDKVDVIRDVAGARFDRIEIGVPLYFVSITDDPGSAVRRFGSKFGDGSMDAASMPLSEKDVLESPVVAIGSVESICDRFLELQDTLGISYFACPWGMKPEDFAPIIDRMTYLQSAA